EQTRRRSSALRYLAPPLLVLTLAAALLASLIGWLLPTLAFADVVADAIALPVVYIGAVVAASIVIGRRLRPAALVWLPAVIIVMHITWGCGFIRGERLS
ncbi:MAG: hypothetical protein RL745_772, partial [Actinomycetota bacterium]